MIHDATATITAARRRTGSDLAEMTARAVAAESRLAAIERWALTHLYDHHSAAVLDITRGRA